MGMVMPISRAFLTNEKTKEGANDKGLDLGYATAWSYGWEELPNMMIPDFNGGASAGAVNPDKSATIKLLKQYGQKNLKQTAKSLPLYWGHSRSVSSSMSSHTAMRSGSPWKVGIGFPSHT